LTRTLAELFAGLTDDGAGGLVTTPPGEGFLFGGLTMSLALAAAARTVRPGFAPRSLHTTFVRAGAFGKPLHVHVTTVGNGRTVATRQATVTQDGRTLATSAAAFHREPAGGTTGAWQREGPSDVPRPDELEPSPVWPPLDGFVEVRHVHREARGAVRGHPYWARARHDLGADPVAHACAVTFVSDYVVIMTMHDGGDAPRPGGIRTLDHALWFHRPARADDWLLYDAEGLAVAATHGVAEGSVVSPAGERVATFVQGDIIASHGFRGRHR